MAKREDYNLSDFQLRAAGRWGNGGVVEVRYQGKPLGSLGLGPMVWSVLGVLIDASIEAQSSDPLEACRTKDEIADTLTLYTHEAHEAEYVKHYLHDLRTSLDSFLRSQHGASQNPQGWGFFLVPTHHKLGYYVAVPPGNL